MALKTKIDYFGIASNDGIETASSGDGSTASEVTATDENGSVVANDVIGAHIAPSNDYVVTADATLEIALGTVTTVSTKKVMLGSVTITTGAGAEPTISASGEEVESSAASECTFAIPEFTISAKRHAQTLFSAFTLTGDGCHVNSATYTASANIGVTEVDGVRLASDVTEGRITCVLSIVQTGTAAPTINAGNGWMVTAPLAETNGNGSYPTWSCTLTNNLTKTIPTA